MRRAIPVCLLSAVITCHTSAASASPAIMFVSDSANHLFAVDMETGQAELAIDMRGLYTDIAYDNSGTLYGITNDYLYRVEPSGWNTLVGAHGFAASSARLDSLTFGPDGTLYAAGDDILVTIDPQTGIGTELGGLSGYHSAGDIVFDGAGRLLLTTDSGRLVEVRQDGSGARNLGNLPYTDIWALGGTADGVIYGIRSTNQMVRIDPSTGAASIIGFMQSDIMMGRAWGGSIPGQFIPEPATLLLFIPGLFALCSRRRHAASPPSK